MSPIFSYIICTVLNTGEEGKQCKDIAKKLIVYPHLSIISNANDIVNTLTTQEQNDPDLEEKIRIIEITVPQDTGATLEIRVEK